MASIFTKLTLLILIAAIAIGVYQKLQSDASTKRVVEYGQQNEIKIDKSAIKREEFKIKYDEAEWKALQSKLDASRYFSRLETVPKYEFGFNPEYAKDLVTYWSKSFDWKKQIDRLNKYQQYRITINNTIIHYIYHETNKGKSVKPTINLLLVDGWPGCSFSFHDMIGHIEKEFKDLSFRIFVPSIPGYGYSTPLNHVVDLVDTAFLFDALMRYENANEYFVHGEDWGSMVTTALAQLFPNRVRGIHITMASVAPELSSLYNFGTYLLGQLIPSTLYTKQEIENHFPLRYSISSRLAMLWHGFGYFHIQATKPDTLGHSFADSPVGLMAYILEKYSMASFDYQTLVLETHDGGLEKLDKDELLSIITIYWMTNCMTSSIRFYKNNMDRMFASTEIKKQIRTSVLPTQVAVGIQQMLIEVFYPPARVVQMKYPNLIQYNIVDGGHFAAFQKPHETAKNFVQFVLKSL